MAKGVPVIMYSGNGQEDVYGGLKPVMFVKNERELVETVKNLEGQDVSELFDEKTERFLEDHSSWDVVIRKELEIVKSFLI